jgi:hypothetical protein
MNSNPATRTVGYSTSSSDIIVTDQPGIGKDFDIAIHRKYDLIAWVWN